MPNRLANESSLYLRQHADNPVDWYPWGDEAFEVARETNRPVLLSIGYSACHWCHVMAHESFEDQATAALMNERFVNVKVDREERPDVDDLYMQATVAMTGHGGWPMTVWLTPDREPFYAGTYFPPIARGGLPGFAELCEHVADTFADRSDEVLAQAGAVVERIRSASRREPSPDALTPSVIDEAVVGLARVFDPANGGFGSAPKFPPSTVLPFMVERVTQHPDAMHVREMLEMTLTRMADGGLHDHVGGGFHRYCVDDVWVVPHFEKMLYDNALLAQAYTLAHVHSGDPRWRSVAERTLDFLMREMMVGDGFAASQDADAPGGEGAFFVWTPAQLDELLPPQQATAIGLRYGVTEDGNFAGGRTVLTVTRPMDLVTHELGVPAEPLLEQALAAMAEARAERPAPGRDDKIIVSWNGLAIAALADAAIAFSRYDYLAAAEGTARLMMTQAVDGGHLYRTIQDGERKHLGQLDDHANLAFGFLRLYRATFNPMYVMAARSLASAIVQKFADPESGGFFSSPVDGESLLARTRDVEDHPTPSGNSQAALVLHEIAAFTGDTAMRDLADGAMRLVRADLTRFPHAFGTALQVADRLARPGTEIAVIGPRDDDRTLALIRAARGAAPGTVLAHAEEVDESTAEAIPLLADRTTVDGAPAAYVCRDHACRAPVTTPDALREQLDA